MLFRRPLSSVHEPHPVFVVSFILFQWFRKKRGKSCRQLVRGKDRISELPDDLLVRILMFVPTKTVVATMFLSKRWRYVWTMVPQLLYEDDTNPRNNFLGGLLGRFFGQRPSRSIWPFLQKSLQNHKAPVLEALTIILGPGCPKDADVGHCVLNAVERKVRMLEVELKWSAERISLPISLYNSCNRLYYLYLSGKILVDVPPSTTYFPSLCHLSLIKVVYKDEDSLVRLLSSCPILKYLDVVRCHEDNVTKFSIKMPLLESLYYYVKDEVGHINGSLDIDCPTLTNVFIRDYSGGSCSIENNPRFDQAIIYAFYNPDNKFLKSLSSIKYFELYLSTQTAACFTTISFNQLIWCKLSSRRSDWLEPLTLLLQNSPNLKTLFMEKITDDEFLEEVPHIWIQPSSVPECLSAKLEIFEWKEYEGRSEERQLLRYIFANSKCLKRAGIAMKLAASRKEKRKMMKELEAMPRLSTSSQLHFSAQLEDLEFNSEKLIQYSF